jgi:hypothetical protein
LKRERDERKQTEHHQVLDNARKQMGSYIETNATKFPALASLDDPVFIVETLIRQAAEKGKLLDDDEVCEMAEAKLRPKGSKTMSAKAGAVTSNRRPSISQKDREALADSMMQAYNRGDMQEFERLYAIVEKGKS